MRSHKLLEIQLSPIVRSAYRTYGAIMVANIFTNIPENLPEELFETLLDSAGVLIERIVSKGHITAAGVWYDQHWDEWVLLLQGQAILRLEAKPQPIHLTAGDYLLIPANTRHRVEWTSTGPEAIWLAIHLDTAA